MRLTHKQEAGTEQESVLIRAEQTKLLYAGLPLTVIATLVNAGLLAAFQWPVIERAIVLTWAGGILLVTLLRGWLGAAFKRSAPGPSDSSPWMSRFFIGTFMAVLLWGGGGIFLFPNEDIAHQAFVAFVLAGMAAGAVTTLSSVWMVALIFLALSLIPLALRFLMVGDSMSLAMGVMVTLFFILVATSARRIGATIRENIASRIERVQSAQSLSRSKYVLDNTLDMIFMFEPDTLQFVYLNKGAVASMGYTREELLQMTPYNIKPQMSETDFRKFIAPLLSGELPSLNFETVHRRKDGSDFPVEIFLQLVEEPGDKGLFVAIVREITERRQAEQELRYQHKQLDVIRRIQSQFIREADSRTLFEEMLTDILSLTNSEYGFIGEILYTNEGQPYLKTYAISNIAWDEETRDFYAENAPQGMEFFNLETLFGVAITSGEPVIANHPETDSRCGGLPDGHPALNAFLGVPVCLGKKMIGMVGLANRPEGYDEELIKFLQPILQTCAHIIEALRNDIQREQAERSQLESVARIRAIVDTVVDAIITINDQGIIESFNPAAESLFGFNADEVIGHNVKMLMPESYSKEHDAYLDNYRRTGERKIIGIGREVTGKRKNGSTFPLELSISEMQLGEQRMFTGIARDISERVEAEAASHEGAARIRAIVDTVVDGIITINDHGIVESFNPAAEHIFGYESNEVIGRNIKMLMPDPYCSEHDRYLDSYRSTGVAKIIGLGREVEGRRKDGTTFPLELAVSEMQLGDQRMFTGIVRDITERKKMDRMKNEFVSTVSHELRTPLTSIRGSLGLIVGGAAGEMPDQARSLVDIAYKNSERLIHIINDILDIEKIASGKLEFNFQVQALMPLIEQSLEENRAYGEQFRVNFGLTDTLEGVSVKVDPERLLQVLSNLLSNAAKFSPPGERVEVSVTRRDDFIRVAVIDHGEGISEAFREQIFQKFSQADSSDTRQKGGTGLGLSISKSIIEKMGGMIGFETQAGAGTTFYFDLPDSRGQSAAHSGSQSLAVDLPRLLVCEDDQDIAHLLCRMLRQSGFEADVACDATQAKAMLKDKRYAAMTLDLGLPGQNGISLIRELRAHDDTRELPIVVVSAKMEEGRLEINGDFSAIDWLKKPVDEGQLTAAVQRALANAEQKPRILHIEDDADVRHVVGEICKNVADFDYAQSLKEAQAKLALDGYSLIVLDLGLPDGSGWEVLPMIKALHPRPPVVVLSASELSSEDARWVAAALVKSQTSNQELLKTIRKVIHA